MTDDLVAFLRARLAEDEQDAASNRGTFPSPVVWDDGGVALHARSDGQAVITWYKEPAEGRGDIASLKAWAAPESGGWTRQRVLAEVAAKRAVLAQLDDMDENGDWVASLHAERIRKAMALAYADSPDYREEWTP